jgi:ABC-type glycerol-3-phosphate transport system substrate-binding protein
MTSDPFWTKILDHVSHVWNTEHIDQEIAFHVDVVDHSQFHNLLSIAVGGGTAPDVAMVDSAWVAGLAQSGFLYALESLVPPDDQSTLKNDFYSVFIQANSFNGKLYGLPVKADISLLWYRKDWLAAEGLEPPRDWHDLLTVAKHFLQPHVQERYGIERPLAFPGGAAGGEATVYNLMPFIWSAGGEIFEGGQVALNSVDTRRALQFVRELVAAHQVSSPEAANYTWETTPYLFAEGKVAMALGGSYESDIILDASGWTDEEFVQQVGCTEPPAAPGGQPVSTMGGTSYVILRQCERPKLMTNVLRTAIEPQVVGELYRSMLQNSPCQSFGVLLDPTTEPLLTRVSSMIPTARARPSIPEYFKASRQLQTMFEAVISTSNPIEEIAQRAAEFIGAITDLPSRKT